MVQAVSTAPRVATGASWLAVWVCFVINMLDGFDILAMAFTAPLIEREWGLVPTELGLLFSAGLAGMVVGSLSLSPIADTIGRRAVLLLCLGIVTAGMMLSAFATELMQLVGLRFLTGLGIGGLLSGLNTVAAEYAPAHQRKFAIGLVTASYSLGATIGGFASIRLIAEFGWPAVFMFGGIASLVMIPIVYFALPESLAFLLSGKPKNALARVNAVMAATGRPALSALPAQAAGAKPSLFDIFKPDMRVGTALICAAYFMNMMTFYFVLSWTPRVIVSMGQTPNVGILASTYMNLAGFIGGVLLGVWANRFPVGRATSVFMVAMYATMILFSNLPANVPVLLAVSAMLGFFMIGTMSGLYTIVAVVFPTHVRATGTGVAIGIGRLGAVVGPYLGGMLIEANWSRPASWAVLGIPALIAAVLATQAAKRERAIEAI